MSNVPAVGTNIHQSTNSIKRASYKLKYKLLKRCIKDIVLVTFRNSFFFIIINKNIDDAVFSRRKIQLYVIVPLKFRIR